MNPKHCVLVKRQHFKDIKITSEKNIEEERVLGEMFQGSENVRQLDQLIGRNDAVLPVTFIVHSNQ